MIKSFNRTSVAVAASAVLGLAAGSVHAQVVVSDTLTGGHSLLNWLALDGACLTAGDNSGTPNDPTQPVNYTPATTTLTIPKCNGLAYYTGKSSTLVGGATGTMPDVAGSGALRLTNGDTTSGGSNGDNQTGAVISNFTFPTNAGVQVTWTSVTYGGDNNQNTGADGISFFLSDGSKSPTTAGGLGGSLGYSCSNVNGKYEGLLGGYVGVGIDEFGNFVNKSDNTATGASGGAKPGAIGVRGAGNITWSELNRLYKSHYPDSTSATDQKTAVIQTCKNGKIWDVPSGASTNTAILDYSYLTHVVLPSTVVLANQQATATPTRAAANPISYSLKITSAGKLDLSYAVGTGTAISVLTGFDLSTNGTLPASFRFGFSAGTGGGNNVHEITCFKAAPADTSNSSAGSNVQQTAQVVTGSQVFLAYYHPVNWWGQLTANALTYSASTDTLSAATTATWDASCVLTGGACSSTAATSGTAQASRAILSSTGVGLGGGVAFTKSSLTAAQLIALGDSTTSSPQIDYLRGARTNEVGSGTGVYRVRTGILGDIVDSSPVWVGYPSSAYSGPWADKLNASATFSEGTTYATFKSNNATRRNIVYVGANDGMLHGFLAGSYAAPVGSAAPVFDNSTNIGTEVLAFVPAQVVAAIHPPSSTTATAPNAAIDFSNPAYSHNFFVDATPGTGDLFYNGNWHTWLVGGLGPGGHVACTPLSPATTCQPGPVQSNAAAIAAPVSSIFALDVTDSSATHFVEANASSIVIGDWNSSTLMCGTVNCGAYLGQTLGTPLIRRLHDGTWGVIFGNGTNSNGIGTSDTGHSGLFIMHVATSDGTITFQYIDAGSTAGGGIVQVASADLDGDHITDYVYGGDTLGNLYRFDLTNSSSTSWAKMKIFQTASGQPITTTPAVTSVPGVGSGNPKVVIVFGTGQKLPMTLTNGEVFSSGTQAIYGIWDANMAAWNGTSTDTKYAQLTQTSSTTPIAIASTALQTQTITESGATRTASNVAMCWSGMSGCASSSSTSPVTVASAMGWMMSLPTSTEQVIYNPLISSGVFFVNTTIPATSTTLTCSSTDVSGWTMGLSLANGGSGTVTAFDGGYSGYSLNGAGTPAIYGGGNSTFLGTNTNDHHTFKAKKTNPQPGVGSRLTWTKIR